MAWGECTAHAGTRNGYYLAENIDFGIMKWVFNFTLNVMKQIDTALINNFSDTVLLPLMALSAEKPEILMNWTPSDEQQQVLNAASLEFLTAQQDGPKTHHIALDPFVDSYRHKLPHAVLRTLSGGNEWKPLFEEKTHHFNVSIPDNPPVQCRAECLTTIEEIVDAGSEGKFDHCWKKATPYTNCIGGRSHCFAIYRDDTNEPLAALRVASPTELNPFYCQSYPENIIHLPNDKQLMIDAQTSIDNQHISPLGMAALEAFKGEISNSALHLTDEPYGETKQSIALRASASKLEQHIGYALNWENFERAFKMFKGFQVSGQGYLLAEKVQIPNDKEERQNKHLRQLADMDMGSYLTHSRLLPLVERLRTEFFPHLDASMQRSEVAQLQHATR